MTTELVALLGDREAGRLHRNRRGRLSFVYDEDWRNIPRARPLSLLMPLTAAEHGHVAIDTFLWGLLPDNQFILHRWAQQFQVSARSAFALISHVGEDCAGAVRFVRPERVDTYVGSDRELSDRKLIEWLDNVEIAQRLRLLRADHSRWRVRRDTGQFSLAGAQPKTALVWENGRWGVPSGRIPTTHILKPPTGAFDGHAENEHFCLMLARRLGLRAAMSQVEHFEDEIAIVIERYDRRRTDRGLVRVHQEDVCQAAMALPTRKYENEGGPGARKVIELLRTHSGEWRKDVSTFVDALIFNWLVAGTDAHAKNYSLLIGARGRVRLAPLYDLASALPYDYMDFQKLRLAMQIGRSYRLRDIRRREWLRFAGDVRLDPDALLHRIESLAERLPDHAAAVREVMASQGLKHRVIDRLCESLAERAAVCRRDVRQPLSHAGAA